MAEISREIRVYMATTYKKQPRYIRDDQSRAAGRTLICQLNAKLNFRHVCTVCHVLNDSITLYIMCWTTGPSCCPMQIDRQIDKNNFTFTFIYFFLIIPVCTLAALSILYFLKSLTYNHMKLFKINPHKHIDRFMYQKIKKSVFFSSFFFFFLSYFETCLPIM